MTFQVCRVCYKTGHDFLSLSDNSNTYSKKLAACVPEIDIYIIDNPGICTQCVGLLDVAYEFRETCLKNEKRYNNTFNRPSSSETRNITTAATQQQQNVTSENNSDIIRTQSIEAPTSTNGILNGQVMDNAPENSNLFCLVCNQKFSSEHDINTHNYKFHRKLKYIQKFTKLLTPIITKKEDLSPVIIFDEESEENRSAKNTLNDNTQISKRGHLLGHVETENQNFRCRECDMLFNDACELESHNLLHVPNLCQICGKTFDTKSDLEDHIKLHSATCCGELFLTPTLLQLHTCKEHNIVCGICNTTFEEFSELFHHLVGHMGEPFRCSSCSKSFQTQVHLREHVCSSGLVDGSNNILKVQNDVLNVQYTKGKTVKCKTCNATFVSRGEYARHFSKEHRIRKLKPKDTKPYISKKTKNVKCNRCNLIFYTRGIFWQHFRRKHSEELQVETEIDEPQSTSQNYKCELCCELFETHMLLQMHIMEIHCNNSITIPLVDCRKDAFYRDQEGLRINFNIPPEQSQITEIDNFCILKQELSNRSKRICFCCRLMFSSRLELYKHLQEKHKECCANKFANLGMLVKHNFRHYKETEKEGIHDKITCLQCLNIYRNYKSLLSHSCCQGVPRRPLSELRTERKPESTLTERKQLSCTIEDHESDSDETVMTADEYEQPLRIMCEMCKSKFDSNTTLYDHIRTTHI